MQAADEYAFSYLRAIAGYWTSFCSLNRIASARGGGTFDEKAMLYMIGLSFTAELGVKGAYETTLGRAAAAIRGPQRTAEDEFARCVATEYAAFLRQTPWYDYPFAARIRQLWHDVPFGPDAVRGTERRIALTSGSLSACAP